MGAKITVEREGWRHRDKLRRRTLKENRGEELKQTKTLTNQPTRLRHRLQVCSPHLCACSFIHVLLFKWIIIHLNSNWACTREGNSRVPLVCPAGSLIWTSDSTRPARSSPATWAELREIDLCFFFCEFILKSVFWYCKKYKYCNIYI